MRERTVAAIRAVLEAAGVEFTNGEQPGVRMKLFKLQDGKTNAFAMDDNSLFFRFDGKDGGKDVTVKVDALALDRLNPKIRGAAEYRNTLEANRPRLFRIAQIKYERGEIDPEGNVVVGYAT